MALYISNNSSIIFSNGLCSEKSFNIWSPSIGNSTKNSNSRMIINRMITDFNLSLIGLLLSILYRVFEASMMAYIPLAAITKVMIFNRPTLKSKLCPEIAPTTTLLA